MTIHQIASDAIGLFLECLSNIEDSGWSGIDEDAMIMARARALNEIDEGTDGMGLVLMEKETKL